MAGYSGHGTGIVDDYSMERDPYTVDRQGQNPYAGVNFGTDLSKIGRSGSGVFGVQQKDVVSEEKRLIDKVFMIVDADRSGQIEKKELRDMFSIFDKDKAEEQFLDAALDRIWQNVMKARASGDLGESINQGGDEQISPTEFYNILSKKFTKDDPRREVENVFHKMNKSGSRSLDVEEIFEISQLLGEDCTRSDITEMFKLFNTEYRRKMAKWEKYRKYFKEAMEYEYKGSQPEDRKKKVKAFQEEQDKCMPKEPKSITIEDFVEVMKADIKTPFPDEDGDEERERREEEERREPRSFQWMMENPHGGGGSNQPMGQTSSIDSKGTSFSKGGTGSTFFGNKKKTTGNAELDRVMKHHQLESWVEAISMHYVTEPIIK